MVVRLDLKVSSFAPVSDLKKSCVGEVVRNFAGVEYSVHMSIEASFRPRFEEIKRRRDAAEQEYGDKASFAAVEDSTAAGTFTIDDQHVVVYSLSHVGVRPYSLSGNGSLRVLGVFPDAEEAISFGKRAHTVDPGSSVFMCPAREWVSAMRSDERMASRAEQDELRRTLLARHIESREHDEAEFQDSIIKSREQPEPMRDSTRQLEDSDDDYEVATPDDVVNQPVPEGGVRAMRNLPASARVDEQRVAVVSFVTHDSTDEFLFKVYACFEDVKEADAWIRNTASRVVDDHHLDVINTCAWISPARMQTNQANNEKFRHEELDKIMKFHKNEPNRVVSYKEQMKANRASES